MRFSIIVPVYNVEKYIRKCLDSIKAQSFQDYEVIIVNDGSPDHSQEIIDAFTAEDSRFISKIKENGGLSDARNYGLPYVRGQYLLFLDSDDYLEPLLLEKLNDEICRHEELDIIRYAIQTTDEDGTVLSRPKSAFFSGLPGKEGVREILKNDLVEPAWIYAYRSSFFLDHGFQYPKGRLHEDFGLTPYVLLMANTISSIDYVGLNYVQRGGSIMNTKNREKDRKKTLDTIDNFIEMRDRILTVKCDDAAKAAMLNFIVRITLDKVALIENREDAKVFMKRLKKEEIYKYLISDTPIRKIKRMIAKYNLSLYFKLFYSN